MEHLLPAQAPLADFVHHNTLHGHQHLPFPDALTAARKLTGNYGYLSGEKFRALYREGRIQPEDLTAVIAGDPELAAGQPLGPVTRGEIIRLIMVHGIGPLTAARLTWEIEERDALTRPRPGAQTRDVAGVWQAIMDRLGRVHDVWRRESRLDAEAEETPLFPTEAMLRADRAQREGIDEEVRREADALWHGLMDRMGTELTLRGLLLALTGEDILEEMRPELTRALAGFLDLGVASWSLPERNDGLWTAWRNHAAGEAAELAVEFSGMNAMEAIESCLERIGVPEERWEEYLERLALELPGWSGMIMWRSLRPGYGNVRTRVEMADYLAVRLALEWYYAARLCRTLWRVEPSLGILGWHFRSHRGELYARLALFNRELPEFLAAHAGRLTWECGEDARRDQEWRDLAHRIRAMERDNPGAAGGAGDEAWPLFVLAQHLGLEAEGVRALAPDTIASMLDLLRSLNDEKTGYLWLQAYERHYRNRILAALNANRGRGAWARRERAPLAQVVFCMDDREEGIRRHLEERVPEIETLGGPGFFGVPVNWRGVDDPASTALCPVVVTPANEVREEVSPGAEAHLRHHRRRRGLLEGCRVLLHRESHRGVVWPTLLSLTAAPAVLTALLGRLTFPRVWGWMTQALRTRFDPPLPTVMALNAPEDHRQASPAAPRTGFTDAEQTARVAGFLRNTGLTYGFSPLVVILGHGSSSLNNPHMAAYDCGACSGRHGGPNARLFAAMANRPEVRERLRQQGIDIPQECWFIGGEHNTGNETIDWFDRDQVPASLQETLTRLTGMLDTARADSAHERARRLASAPRQASPAKALTHMERRGLDFSQARPELGHATNAAALIGRRSVTRGAFFDRRMFLISYDPTQDPDGSIVEGILLAAGPVGAGISLEYYFSTVDNDRYGCGTKVVHNITGLFGVMEGTGSDLRTGLPQQMIEIHEAMRLLVIVEQKPAILTAIYQRQPEIRELVGNAWIILAAIDPEDGAIHLFDPAGGWQPWNDPAPGIARTPSSRAWYAGHSGPLPPALIVPEERP
ncbi:MAG: DUF2309 domain-containing protein [Magnetococcales bacterium]|nr:DUF2309 domain-containing protein [Magnetococcales bacterium]